MVWLSPLYLKVIPCDYIITFEHMVTNGSRKGTFNNLDCLWWHTLMFRNLYFQMPKGFASIGSAAESEPLRACQIYKFTCGSCSASYTGKTFRHFKESNWGESKTSGCWRLRRGYSLKETNYHLITIFTLRNYFYFSLRFVSSTFIAHCLAKLEYLVVNCFELIISFW